MTDNGGTATAPRFKILRVPFEGELWRGAVVIDLCPRSVPLLMVWAEFSFRDYVTGKPVTTCVSADIHAGPGDDGVYADLTLLTDEGGEPLPFGESRVEPVERDGEWLAGVFRFGISSLPRRQS